MKILKTIIYTTILAVIGLYVYIEFDKIYYFYYDLFNHERDNITITNNSYAKSDEFIYFKTTSDFIAKDKEHIKNIFYTILNSGVSEFTFYCDRNYETCISDIESYSGNKEELSVINNYIHPYNSFNKIETAYTGFGTIKVAIEKNYSPSDIQYINKEISNIFTATINSKYNDRENIRLLHNYIIDKTIYDESYSNTPNSAYYLLNHHKSVCTGYTDITAIMLSKLGIPNYKIAGDEHIWNLVYIDNYWYHLDLTWDDPVNVNKDYENQIRYLFFLIDTTRLYNLDNTQHNFNKLHYQEA